MSDGCAGGGWPLSRFKQAGCLLFQVLSRQDACSPSTASLGAGFLSDGTHCRVRAVEAGNVNFQDRSEFISSPPSPSERSGEGGESTGRGRFYGANAGQFKILNYFCTAFGACVPARHIGA